MMYWNGDWSWGAWLGMTAMMVVFWGAVAWAIVAAVRGSGATPAAGSLLADILGDMHAALLDD